MQINSCTAGRVPRADRILLEKWNDSHSFAEILVQWSSSPRNPIGNLYNRDRNIARGSSAVQSECARFGQLTCPDLLASVSLHRDPFDLKLYHYVQKGDSFQGRYKMYRAAGSPILREGDNNVAPPCPPCHKTFQ